MDRGGSKLQAPVVEFSPSKKISSRVIGVGGFQLDKIVVMSYPGLMQEGDQQKLDLNSL